jgi:transglutaminase-like putative cysteine protease
MPAMLYDITLRLGYDYAHPVAHARHLLRIEPRSLSGMQRVISSRVRVRPVGGVLEASRDFFGNILHTLLFHDPHETVDIHLTARVERQVGAPVLALAPDLAQMQAELAGLTALGPDSPLHFLSASPRITDPLAFRSFAAGLLRPDMNAIEAMRTIGAALSKRMVFDAKATDVDTPPMVAFRAGRGVCQDYAQIMIACLRAVGIPAAYVSGFLRTQPPPGQERLPGADAMHAWVRVWCGEAVGWFEYDPTNALDVADDHILVGYGRDYADVAPIRGVSRTAGGQVGEHNVDVVPVT